MLGPPSAPPKASGDPEPRLPAMMRHRVASGLPPQPAPLGAKAPPRPGALEALKASVSSTALGPAKTFPLPDQPPPEIPAPAPPPVETPSAQSLALAKLSTPISAKFGAPRSKEATARREAGSAARAAAKTALRSAGIGAGNGKNRNF